MMKSAIRPTLDLLGTEEIRVLRNGKRGKEVIFLSFQKSIHYVYYAFFKSKKQYRLRTSCLLICPSVRAYVSFQFSISAYNLIFLFKVDVIDSLKFVEYIDTLLKTSRCLLCAYTIHC